MKRRLLDIGPLVAYVDAADPAHGTVAAALDEYTGRLHTTSAVVTEAMHCVVDDPSGPDVLAEFLVTTGTEIAEITDTRQLQAAVALMRKHHDIPMDFADATLVLLAGELGVTDIVTLDRRGFGAYRTSAGKAFRLFPAQRR